MSLAQRYIDTYFAHDRVAEELYDYARNLLGFGEDDYPFEEVWVDPADWEGHSLELKDARAGLVATRDQCNRAHDEHGFDVIDIQYGENRSAYKRFYPDATRDRWHRIAYIHGNSLDTRIGDDIEGWWP